MAKKIIYDEAWAKKIVAMYTTPDIQATRSAIIDHLPLQTYQNFLDIGSGPGLLVNEVADKLPLRSKVIGIDISEAMVEIAKRNSGERSNVQFIQGDATHLEFEDHSFDCIASTQALAYVDNVSKAISEAFRVLKPHGTFIILDTDWECLCWNCKNQKIMKDAIHGWITHCPHPYLPRQLRNLLEQSGFTVNTVTAHPIINTRLAENTFSEHMMDFIGKYLIDNGIFTEEKVDEWKKETRETKDYFFCLNRFIFVATKETN